MNHKNFFLMIALVAIIALPAFATEPSNFAPEGIAVNVFTHEMISIDCVDGCPVVTFTIPEGQLSQFPDGTVMYFAGPYGWPEIIPVDQMPVGTVVDGKVSFYVRDLDGQVFQRTVKFAAFSAEASPKKGKLAQSIEYLHVQKSPVTVNWPADEVNGDYSRVGYRFDFGSVCAEPEPPPDESPG